MLDWSHPIVVTVIGLGCSGVLGLCVWLVRAVGDVRGILIGPDGTNGVRGDLRELIVERKAELSLHRQQREEDIRARAVMQTQIERLEGDHRLLAKRLAALEVQRTQYHPDSHRTQL